MTLPIIENPLYGLIQLETAAFSSPFTWVDRTADLASGFNYYEGGRAAPPGQSMVDSGVLNATFKDVATVPIVGDLVRLRRFGTTEYFFTGYVVDVSQTIVFDQSISLTTPVTLTTINCSDWVGYVSQFQAIGAGGYTSGGAIDGESRYTYPSRARALNRIIDPSGSTAMIDIAGGAVATQFMGDTDSVGSISEHLDLIVASTAKTMWWGTHALPTNTTTGRTGLIRIQDTAPTSSGYTFRDTALATAGNLHYTEIDFQNSSQNIANDIVLNNRARLHVADYQTEVSNIGGYSEQNFMIVNNQNVLGIPVDQTTQDTDATSITTYGTRQSQINTNASVQFPYFNLFANPSAEYSDDGFSAGSTAHQVRRNRPADDPNPFSPPIVPLTGLPAGEWAIRSLQTSSAGSIAINFIGGETNGQIVVPTVGYKFEAEVARGTVSQSNTRAWVAVTWLRDNETAINTVSGAKTTLTTANTWYHLTLGGFAVAPAGAVRARLTINYDRVSGSIQTNDRLWCDMFLFSDSDFFYFDGDTPDFGGASYGWVGGVGDSPSYQCDLPYNLGGLWLDDYSTTSMRATRIRWNAQEDLTAVSSLTVGKTISLVYDGTTTTHRIVGINGNVDPERYMIDYYLIKI